MGIVEYYAVLCAYNKGEYLEFLEVLKRAGG